ncbi:Ankrd39 [Symbiodinium natans]|uniref:Ankrd39 protein n=1 Tax=Symbiodinium natans TaxID=878477 RepID=A0A812S9P9_9DINO|nr:Ankrd39 [Symbiodinium natans]
MGPDVAVADVTPTLHGHWCIGGKEARLRHFDWNRCFLYQSAPQGPERRLPLAPLPWQWWDSAGSKWVLDRAIRVLDVPHASVDQRLALAQQEVVALRAWAEVARRRATWWMPPAPPKPEVDEAELMAERAAGLASLGVDLTSPLFTDDLGATLLLTAAEQGWVELCGELLSSSRPGYLEAQDLAGRTALFRAVGAGHRELGGLLLSAKACPSSASVDGLQPLHAALSSGREELASALLASRANAAARLPSGQMPKDYTDPDGRIRSLLDSALVSAPRPRRKRSVAYGKEEAIGISWHRDAAAWVVRSLSPGDPASEAGVRPGWVLLRVDGAAPGRVQSSFLTTSGTGTWVTSSMSGGLGKKGPLLDCVMVLGATGEPQDDVDMQSGKGKEDPEEELLHPRDLAERESEDEAEPSEGWRDTEPWEYKNDKFEEDFTRLLETLRTGLPVLSLPSLYEHGLGWVWPGLEREGPDFCVEGRTIKKDSRHASLKEYLSQRERAGLISRQEVEDEDADDSDDDGDPFAGLEAAADRQVEQCCSITERDSQRHRSSVTGMVSEATRQNVMQHVQAGLAVVLG